ncbi:MAG: ABC transporter substrate-binding protein [Caldilineaceae bacterium]|nr:ABC transporter substrate-binding protein [Caldilineaceae bacterium]
MKPFPYRFIFYLIAVAGLVFLFLASCQQSSLLSPMQNGNRTTAENTARVCPRGDVADVPEVVIGVIYPLSERAIMSTAFAMQAATNLALADINEQGGINGKPLRLVVYDSGSSPAQGALFAERLATLDCVAGIVGVFHSDVALAVKEVAVRYHIPIIFADPYADEITADQADEVFRIAPTRTMLGQMMGEWLATIGDYNGDGAVSSVLLVANTRYGTMRTEMAQQWLPRYGIQSVSFTVDLPATDFSPIIARIVALDRLPDAVFVYLHHEDSFLLQRQLLAAGIGPDSRTLLVMPQDALDDTNFWQQVPNGIQTVVTQIGPWPTTVTAVGQRFANLYQQYFKRWPEATAFEAYDALWLMADAIQRADTLQPDAIIRALENTDLELASGYYSFPYGSTNPPDGEEVPAYLWHQWPNPQLLYLQYTEAGQSARNAPVIWPPTYQTVDGPLAPQLRQAQATPTTQ